MSSQIASIEDVNSMLTKTKQYIDDENIHFQEREKNMEYLNTNGISIDDALTYVYEMDHHNYSKGPEEDRDTKFAPGDVWIFGLPEGFIPDTAVNDEVYVKLKELLQTDRMICLSFHKAQWPISYAYPR
ncbi:hypothetical protein [Bacillus weihaiensis]|uniref:hypothetical protein n=1 Tax=Bacillus weihaiensis TaxID=1547283 RepID=UPI0023539E3C|nr:hypothetical protein [Bacillus weihaiensis]